VFGINHRLYEPERHRLLTAASWTTHCLAPLVKVVHKGFGIVNRHPKLRHRFASLSVTFNWCRDRIGHFLCLRRLSG
jgi:glyceraldehyde-3-phosphate dehydrogenase/erythrose-4-phosphate dehydrogenase